MKASYGGRSITGSPIRAPTFTTARFQVSSKLGVLARPTVPANRPAKASKWSEVSQIRDRSGWMFTKIRKRRSPCEGRVGEEPKGSRSSRDEKRQFHSR